MVLATLYLALFQLQGVLARGEGSGIGAHRARSQQRKLGVVSGQQGHVLGDDVIKCGC